MSHFEICQNICIHNYSFVAPLMVTIFVVAFYPIPHRRCQNIDAEIWSPFARPNWLTNGCTDNDENAALHKLLRFHRLLRLKFPSSSFKTCVHINKSEASVVFPVKTLLCLSQYERFSRKLCKLSSCTLTTMLSKKSVVKAFMKLNSDANLAEFFPLPFFVYPHFNIFFQLL